MARDITEGRAERAIAVDIGVVSSTNTWQNTDIAYDVAIGGLPFIYAINDARPYIRQTAPYRKDQFDNGQEPGEQSLTGWWLRSQSSFHTGTGIKFFDPAQTDENGHYRFTDSRNIDVWTKGQATLLKETANMSGVTTGTYKLISVVDGTTDQVVLGVRNTYGTSEKDPLKFAEVKTYIDADQTMVGAMVVRFPNITNIVYGRDVGYKIEQVKLGDEIEAISATQKRKEIGI